MVEHYDESGKNFGGGFKESLRLGIGDLGDVLASVGGDVCQHLLEFPGVTTRITLILGIGRIGHDGVSLRVRRE
jgi:hypothetical protein